MTVRDSAVVDSAVHLSLAKQSGRKKMGIPPTFPRQHTSEKGIPMPSILPYYPPTVKDRILKSLRRCRDAKLHKRYLIVVNLLHDWDAYDTAERLGVHNTTVYRVAKRFQELGEAGLLDGREDNGQGCTGWGFDLGPRLSSYALARDAARGDWFVKEECQDWLLPPYTIPQQ